MSDLDDLAAAAHGASPQAYSPSFVRREFDHKRIWYLNDGGEQSGPHSEQALADFSAQRRLSAQALVWQHGWSEWLPASRFDWRVAPPAPRRVAPRKNRSSIGWIVLACLIGFCLLSSVITALKRDASPQPVQTKIESFDKGSFMLLLQHDRTAEARFRGRVVEITSFIESIVPQHDGGAYIWFDPSNGTGGMYCFFTPSNVRQLKDLRRGNIVTLHGQFTGVFPDATLRDCTVTDVLPGEAQ